MQFFLAISIGQHILDELKHTTPLEWFGAITGVLCVYLAAKQSIWNWPIAILSVAAYVIVFYQNKLFGDAGLQVYFFARAFMGGISGLKRSKDKKSR